MILCMEALTWLALQKSSNTWKSVFCIANNISFHEKEKSFMYLGLTLKIAFSNFLWERSFSASVALHSLHLLSCTKHSISVLRSSKLVILCIEALTWLALQKSSNTWNLSSALQITFHFMRKKILHVLELYS